MSLLVEDPREVEFDIRTDEMLVNMGPQHPSTHGVLRLLLKTDGEVVHECTPHIGYLHRCAEKIGEHLAPMQWLPYTDRMDYLSSMNMNLGLALTVEKLLKLESTPRADAIRVAIAELGRIASHLVAMGTYGLDLGTFSPFLYAFREREIILDLFEHACGARLTYSFLQIGGPTHDLPQQMTLPPSLATVTGRDTNEVLSWPEAVRVFLDWLEPRIREYHTLLTTNAIFVQRTAGIGVLSPEMARSYNCTSAVLRGSGIDFDLRRDGEAIYTRLYDDYDFEIPVAPWPRVGSSPAADEIEAGEAAQPAEAVLGDCWSRFYVRMREVAASIGLVRQALDRYDTTPPGHRNAAYKLTTKLPADECYLETECPRGQMGFYLVGKGHAHPLRARAKSSSLCNLAVVEPLCRGVLLADVPAIVGSVDVVMGEVDR